MSKQDRPLSSTTVINQPPSVKLDSGTKSDNNSRKAIGKLFEQRKDINQIQIFPCHDISKNASINQFSDITAA